MVIRGRIQNGVVVLDSNASLPEGTEVTVVTVRILRDGEVLPTVRNCAITRAWKFQGEFNMGSWSSMARRRCPKGPR